MKIWTCNWATVQDVECDNQDGVELEGLAFPAGILLADIADIAKVQKMAQDDFHELVDCDTGDAWVMTEDKQGHDFRSITYMYGEDLMMICVQREVM